MMTEKINEPIEVLVKFEKGKLIPFQFSWRGQNYPLKKIEFVHFSEKGNARLYFFSAVGAQANYQLVFDSQRFTWRLGKVEAPGL